jgi:hypothetical protein
VQYEDETDHPAATAMLGSDVENPGPDRDTQPTDGDPTDDNPEHTTRTVGMPAPTPSTSGWGTQDTDVP